MPHLPEERESLWLLIASPVLWAAHFLLSYCTAAIWCAKVAGPDGSLTGARIAIAAYTAIALVGIGINGWSGLRRHHHEGGEPPRGGEPPHDADSPEDRHRFLGFATLLLSALSAVAVVFEALPAVFLGDCR